MRCSKLVTLTPRGVKTKQDLLKEFRRPPAELLELDEADLRELERVLLKLSRGRAVKDDGPDGGADRHSRGSK